MSTNTTNYALVKPDPITEFYNVEVQNGNMDIIDAELAKRITKTTAAITYYVRTDGNDANDGSANDAAHAIKTIQSAINRLPKHLSHNVTINVASGTYDEDIEVFGFCGNGVITILGDTVVSSTRTIKSIHFRGCICQVSITGFNFTTTTTNSITITQCQRVIVNYCNMVQVSSSNGFGIGASNVYIHNNVISNKNYAIYVSFISQVSSYENGGSNNSVGVYLENCSMFSKTGTQPIGATQETVLSGAIVTGNELTITITSGFAAGWSGVITIKKSFDNLVEINGTILKTSTISSTGENVVTFPIGVRPIVGINNLIPAFNSGGGAVNAVLGISVSTGGIFGLYNPSNLSTAQQAYQFKFMYYSD